MAESDSEFLNRMADSVCGVSSLDVQRLRQIAKSLPVSPAPSLAAMGVMVLPDGTTISPASAVCDDYEDMLSLDGDSDPYHNVGNAD
jgi:hypothetical protein